MRQIRFAGLENARCRPRRPSAPVTGPSAGALREMEDLTLMSGLGHRRAVGGGAGQLRGRRSRQFQPSPPRQRPARGQLRPQAHHALGQVEGDDDEQQAQEEQ